MFELNGKNVLVTGGGRGIGRGIVEMFANAGADNIAFCFRDNQSAAKEAADSIKQATGKEVLFFQADVTQDEGLDQIKKVIDDFGGVDVLVNNAGMSLDAPHQRMKGQWEEVIAVNQTAPYRISQLALPKMKQKRDGVIINVGSVVPELGIPGTANYAASKIALVGWTRVLASEVGRYNIRANVVSPGIVETDLTKDKLKYLNENYGIRMTIQGYGHVTPEDVGAYVVFLSSEGARFVTGQNLRIDGGMTFS